MSAVDDAIGQLRAELAGLSGTARAAPLIRLGQSLLFRLTQTGTVAPSAAADVDAAVSALEEALGYLGEDDPIRGSVSFYFGYALTARHAHSNDEKDRDAAIRHFDAALGSAKLAVQHVAGARMMLGYHYLLRAMAPMMFASSLMGTMAARTDQTQVTDADRAADCFRAVLAAKPPSEDICEMAQMMLEFADGIRVMLGGGQGGINLQKLSEMMASLSALQERLTREAKPGYGPFNLSSVFSLSFKDSLSDLNPMDRPVVVVEGELEDEEPPELPKLEPAAPEPVDLRHSLRTRLSLTEPVWESAALLLSEVDTPAVAVVDEAVAMASTVVDGDEEAEPADEAVDWFLLAVALHLRDRLDSAGDRQAGADALLTAARKVPVDHPAAVVILRSLGAFLDPDAPLGGVLDRVAAGFAGRLDAVLAGDSVTDPGERANLHALRCVCRAAWAVGELGRAVDHVQPDYPWPDPLKAAARSAG
ncbi:hypothetical protein [Actinocrispum wychmicini]|uniref:Tetratricopeptide repeat protein n=1 Tax=Actinocrispum wychmicini TaxID=1213861 RepID=A0A4R2JFB3_9PSEU|nr:hypothetical protein [Actinocrispum wychmicini]TCO52925.1 hypothetical protein EV192_111119 [Actinocrispum wychmicini]